MIIIDDMDSLNKKLTTKLEECRGDASKTVNELHKRLHETVSVDTHLQAVWSFPYKTLAHYFCPFLSA